jgi:predicted aspartyl protease
MKYKIKLKYIELEADGCHLLLEAKIGKEKLCLVVDTGASKTALDTDWLRAILPGLDFEKQEQASAGLGTTTMESALAVLPQLKLGKLQLRHLTVAVLDLSHIRESYRQLGLGELHGVLGGDILQLYKARISYPKNRLTLYDAS